MEMVFKEIGFKNLESCLKFVELLKKALKRAFEEAFMSLEKLSCSKMILYSLS